MTDSSTSSSSALWVMSCLDDHRPLMKYWEQSFGSKTLTIEVAVRLCDFYGFKASVCEGSFDTLSKCLEIVRSLFARETTFSQYDGYCQAGILKFLGLSEHKNLLSEAATKKLAMVFSSYEEVLDMNFSDSEFSAACGKDVLRIFQAILGISLLDVRIPKASHLGYLTQAQRVIRGEGITDSPGRSRVGDSVPIEATNQEVSGPFHSGFGREGLSGGNIVTAIDGSRVGDSVPMKVTNQSVNNGVRPDNVGVWILCLPEENADFYDVASKSLMLFLALLVGGGEECHHSSEYEISTYVRTESFKVNQRLMCNYLSYPFLRRLEESDLLSLLKLFKYSPLVTGALNVLNVLISFGDVGNAYVIRESNHRNQFSINDSNSVPDSFTTNLPSSSPMVGSDPMIISSVKPIISSSPVFSFPLETSRIFPVVQLGSTPLDPSPTFNLGSTKPVPLSSAVLDPVGIAGLTLVAREQPSRSKGDRTLKALMIADAYVQMVSVDPKRVLGTVMADVFLSLVTHTGILTQLALVDITQILQSVNYPSYALAIPLTMSTRHDLSQALTTSKLFVGWRSEEAFPESRATRYDYRSNNPALVNRVLWTIFRIRYGFFEYHTEIWDALVRYALRCEKLIQNLFHWSQEAVEFMIQKALRDLEMLDDRVGLAIPSSLIAPSPDAVNTSPILSVAAYRDAIDLLPDMQAADAYYRHHHFVMEAQTLHHEGRSVRYVIPIVVVPLFKTGLGNGNRSSKVDSLDGLGIKRKNAQISFNGTTKSGTHLAVPSGSPKGMGSGSNKKRRQAIAFLPANSAQLNVPVAVLPNKRPKNKPCHQWLSTVGCTVGVSCPFDHAAPANKSTWEYCSRRLGELGLIAGAQIGVCPAL